MMPVIDNRLVRRLAREYNRAIRAEENAVSILAAYRLAKISERCLRRLQAAQAGLSLPEPRMPQTARNLGKQGFAVLATIGRVVSRAVVRKANLAKAQIAGAIARAARKAARQVRQALRSAVRAVVSRVVCNLPIKTKEIMVVQAPNLAPGIHLDANQVLVENWGLLQFVDDRFKLVGRLCGDRFVFSGGLFGEHSLAADELITDARRLIAHWHGYVDNTVRAWATRMHIAATADRVRA